MSTDMDLGWRKNLLDRIFLADRDSLFPILNILGNLYLGYFWMNIYTTYWFWKRHTQK